MKPIHLILAAVLLTVSSNDLANAAPAEEKVIFLADSISRKDDTTITLLSGAMWQLGQRTLSLVTDDVIIVFREIPLKDKTKATSAVFYGGGDEIFAKHIGGKIVAEGGILTSVVKAHSKGAVLQLANGRLYSVPQYDRYGMVATSLRSTGDRKRNVSLESERGRARMGEPQKIEARHHS